MAAENCGSSEMTKEVQRFLPEKFDYKGQEWTFLSQCGKGTFSSCFRVCSSSGRLLALKVYKEDTKYREAFANELIIFKMLEDGLRREQATKSYVVKFIDSFTLIERKCILMELLGCNLNDILIKHERKGFSMYLIKRCLHDLLSAVAFLEGLGLVHGDIKPTNVLWNMNMSCFQVVDFGLSFKAGEQPRQSLQSPGYQAPEVLVWNREITGNKPSFIDSQKRLGLLDSSIDTWSVGCVIACVSTGQQFYATEHAQQLPRLCSNCNLKSGSCCHSQRLGTVLSSIRNVHKPDELDNLVEVLSSLLHCIPSNRLSAQAALKHLFLTSSHSPRPSVLDLLLIPTKILRLLNIFHPEIEDDTEDILRDVREECEDFGHVISITTGQKSDCKENRHVYVEFECAEDCKKGQKMLMGKKFDGRVVVATFFPVEHFLKKCFY